MTAPPEVRAMDALCSCGYSWGDHAAVAPHPCLAVPPPGEPWPNCPAFRPAAAPAPVTCLPCPHAPGECDRSAPAAAVKGTAEALTDSIWRAAEACGRAEGRREGEAQERARVVAAAERFCADEERAINRAYVGLVTYQEDMELRQRSRKLEGARELLAHLAAAHLRPEGGTDGK